MKQFMHLKKNLKKIYGMIIQMMLNLHMQRMKIRIFLFGFHDMQKTIQQIKLSS